MARGTMRWVGRVVLGSGRVRVDGKLDKIIDGVRLTISAANVYLLSVVTRLAGNIVKSIVVQAWMPRIVRILRHQYEALSLGPGSLGIAGHGLTQSRVGWLKLAGKVRLALTSGALQLGAPISIK